MIKTDENETQQFELLIQGLIDKGYGCCDDFLPPSTIIGLRNNMTKLLKSGEMKTAGIGNKQQLRKDELIRNDKVKWIDDDSINSFEVMYLLKVNRLINHLNHTCYTSLNSFESHYANYEKGSFYKKHIDQFKNEKGRQFSIVLYLNDDWQDEDEGSLSLYPEGSSPKSISPIAGRIVFFRSSEMEHEVHPSNTRDRKSIAGWLKN